MRFVLVTRLSLYVGRLWALGLGGSAFHLIYLPNICPHLIGDNSSCECDDSISHFVVILESIIYILLLFQRYIEYFWTIGAAFI